MNVQRDPDAILAAWLEEGPTGLPEPTRRAIAVSTRTTDQKRRSMWAPWRNPLMTSLPRLAVAAIAVIAVAGGAIYFLRPGPGVGGTTPTPSPSVSSAPSSAPPSPAAAETVPIEWTSYTSPRFAYSIDYPADWVATPATADWLSGALPPDVAYLDKFGATSTSTRMMVSSFLLKADDDGAAKFAELDAIAPDCRLSDRHDISLDGVTARQEDFFCFGTDYGIEVVVVNGGRFYQLDLFSQTPFGEADRATFDRFLASFRFGAAPLDTATWVTFDSMRYGYTIDHPGQFAERPATKDWAFGVVADVGGTDLDRFTGAGDDPDFPGGFLGVASQPLPDGMTPDAWIAGHAERNRAAFGDACGGRPEDWVATSIAGQAGRLANLRCLDHPVTEIAFTYAGRGWVISGDTPIVEAARLTLQLPT